MRKYLFLFCFLIFLTRISSAQNIGINTTGAAPASTNMLEVLQPSAATNTVGIYVSHTVGAAGITSYGLQALNSSAGLNNIAAYLSASGATNNYALIVPSGGGNVGIGTTAPGVPLDVTSGNTVGIRYIKTGSADARITLGDPTQNWSWATGWAAGGDFSLIEEGTSGNRIYVKRTTGNVGIGTSSPIAKFHVAAGGQIIGTNGSSSNTRTLTILEDGDAQTNFGSYPGAWTSALQIQDNTTSRYIWLSPLDNASGANSRLLSYNTGLDFYVGANAYAATIASNGNVGIGSSSPAYRLDLGNGSFGFGSSNQRTETRNDAGLQGSAGAQSGMFETSAPAPAANWPAGAANWWHLFDVRHSNPANNYAMQFAGSFFDQNLYFRKTNNSASQAWSQILTTANGVTNSCGSVNYLPKMTTATNIGCSQVYDNGTNVGIGTTTVNYKLSVNGQVANIQDAASYAQTTLQTWGLYSPGTMYVEPGVGSNFYLVPNNWSQSLTTTIYGQVGIGASPVNVYATDLWIDENIHVQGNENLNQGGRGRMRVGTAWNYMGLYTDGSSTGASNDLVLGASSGIVRVGPWAGSGQHLRWANSILRDDQGGTIELGGNDINGGGGTGTPYMDWHINDGYTRDFDIRMIGTTDGSGPVMTWYSHAGGTQYRYFDLDWIGAYDCWADVSAWRYWANASDYLYWDIVNDLDIIDNIRPKYIIDPKSGKQSVVNDPESIPDFLVRKTKDNKGYAYNVGATASFSLGAIRMLRKETKTRDEMLEARIERLEKIIEQQNGKQLGEIEFTATATAFKDVESFVVMDARITKESKITISGLSGYEIVNLNDGSFAIKFSSAPASDVKFTYSSKF